MVNHILNDHRDLLQGCLESKANDENYDNADFNSSDESEPEAKCFESNSQNVIYQRSENVTINITAKYNSRFNLLFEIYFCFTEKSSLNSVPFGFMKDIGKIGHSFYQNHAEVL